KEAAQAFRDRSACLLALNRTPEAEADLKRARQLEADARTVAQKRSPNGDGKNGQIELSNEWRAPIIVVIDGTSYTLAVGETRQIGHAAGTFRYELPSTGQVATGTVEAGKTFRLRIAAR